MRSLLTNNDITVDEIYEIFDLAAFYLKNGIKNDLLGKVVFSVFFESSTRTETSFSLAASKLGCLVEKVNVATVALKKGEHLVDFFTSLNGLSPNAFIIRHSQSGVLHILEKYIDCCIVNAGDGTNEHPTQGLIDAFTVLLLKEKIEGLNILVCGDIIRSRVAHSTIPILQRLGATVSISGPLSFMPTIQVEQIIYYDNFPAAAKSADVIIMLRTQTERTGQKVLAGTTAPFCLDENILKDLSPDVLIMHPGPIHRNCEISNIVLDDPRCAILTQVRNSQYVRAAVLNFLIKS
ncbi:aspartate carbamoyltransferase catalytic subunit [Neorickettsia risticii]|uniref:Aspartate carbamoyltransferase n=1 Tax=Neorickettsia risticii (strain Illinois) TaxID=434131 RepID=C6V4Z8_NEORI|nr:aspartate carbamoyltransferase catalytic subunit [Neorickettsia risticii]ACT69463.1 aspartate carbamoyltransferase [Neorickettsia risticii str. Illinois]